MEVIIMNEEIFKFYLKTSMYTNYEPYKDYYKSLPDDMEELTDLILSQTIHRKELRRSRKEQLEHGKSHDHISEEYPWWEYISHDDILLTAPAITAELFRKDIRGFAKNREIKNKVVITCRYVAILLASIFKTKGISCRVRSGFASYFTNDGRCFDHWIIEYYSKKENRWIICDPNKNSGKDHIDMPHKSFCWIAEVWLNTRSGKDDINKYIHGSSFQVLNMLAYTLFFDFHALMGDEISYLFKPSYIDNNNKFFNLTEEELKELDDLATLMLDPNKNFDELRNLFNNNKKLRIVNTPLISDKEHLELEINN